MSELIGTPGTYRGTLLDQGVSETKNGYPQFVARLCATEVYDPQADSWVEIDPAEITAYMVLFTQKNGQWEELLNAKQLKVALGWAGDGFTSLAEGDYSDKVILFRVEENTYNGNTSLRVAWIDAWDANPTAQVQKYDTAALKVLDGKFAGVMKAPAPKPATAPARAKGKPGRPPKAGAAPAKKKTASPPPVDTPASDVTTKEGAWEFIYNYPHKPVDMTDDALGDLWLAAVSQQMENAGVKDEAKLGPADWDLVANSFMEKWLPY